MARIRTIKPEFFRHEGLQDLGATAMLVFAGLWTQCDREGRFEWKPRLLKLDILPFTDFNMEEILERLVNAKMIVKYEVEGNVYGHVPNFERHQIVGRDEPPSEIPAFDGTSTPYFRPLTQTQRFKIYESDNWRCVYCGRDMHNDHRAACLDHVVPYSKGGTNREQNMVTSCKKCNAIKGGRTPEEACLPWPKGKGEYIADGMVNGTLTYGQPPVNGASRVPDKEREWEREEEKEIKRKLSKEKLGDINEINIPAWVPLIDFSTYLKMRVKIKKPLLKDQTTYDRFFKKLKKICDDTGSKPEEILQQSIDCSWQGIFPITKNRNFNSEGTSTWKEKYGVSEKAIES